MTSKLGVFTLMMLLGAAVTASAAQAKPAAQKATAAKAAKATTLMTAGKIVKFDSGSNTLTVSTKQGEAQFMLSPAARIMEGRKSVAASQLASLTDRQVQVRYTESEGHKMASSVRIEASPRARTETTSKTTKTPKKS
jgi:hypothetical protein